MNEVLKESIIKGFKNTTLGFLRIRKNLEIMELSDAETEEYLKETLSLTSLENIEMRGKNHL